MPHLMNCEHQGSGRCSECVAKFAEATLLEWLHEKLEAAEKSLIAREQMDAAWRSGTDQSWRAASCRLSKEQRIEEADRQARIADKMRCEVSNFKAVIEIVSHSNGEIRRSGESPKP